MSARRRSGLIAAVASAGVACGAAGCSSPLYTCTSSEQCVDDHGSAGVCEPTGYCSFTDDSCASGRRYGSYSGDLGNQCVAVGPESRVEHLGSVFATATDEATILVDASGLPSESADRSVFLVLSVASQNYESVAQVSGGGASWSLVHEQCSSRHITMASVWLGALSGSAGGTVEVTLEAAAETSIAALSAFDTPGGSADVELLGSANSGGSGGGCPGTGTDTRSFSVPAAPARAASYVLVAIAPRHRTATGEQGSVTLLAEEVSSGAAPAGITVLHYPRSALEDQTASGELSGDEDWAAVALELY